MIPRVNVFENFFTDGGLAMYPTAICGFLLVVSSVLLALRPERRYVWLVVSTGLMTLGSGVLGTIAGLVVVFRYAAIVPPDHRVEVAVTGLAQLLHCMMFAMIFLQTSFWLVGIAAFRVSRRREVGQEASSTLGTTASAA